MVVVVEDDIGEGHARILHWQVLRSAAAQEHADAGDDLLERERLGDVVVPADRQSADAIFDGVFGGEEKDGRVDAVCAHPRERVEAVHARHHHVEHDDVRAEAACDVERLGAIAGHLHVEALVLQAHLQ